MRTTPSADKQGRPVAGVGDALAPETVRQAFVVLDMPTCKGSLAPGAILALGQDIPGVRALHVDVARGKIHVLYDGTVAAIDQLGQALRTLEMC